MDQITNKMDKLKDTHVLSDLLGLLSNLLDYQSNMFNWAHIQKEKRKKRLIAILSHQIWIIQTYDTWWGVNILYKFQLPSSYGFEDWEKKDDWLTRWIRNKGVCITAPATLGLSKTRTWLVLVKGHSIETLYCWFVVKTWFLVNTRFLMKTRFWGKKNMFCGENMVFGENIFF